MKGLLRFLPLVLISAGMFGAQPQLRRRTGCAPAPTWATRRSGIAAADFKPVGDDPQTPALKAVFDATLYSDLANAGIFDLVSKSLAPQAMPGSPQEINLSQWSAAPANAAMVAFGALSATNGRLAVYGWLFDTRNTRQSAGAGQAVQRSGQRGYGAHGGAPVCGRDHLPAGRRHQRHCRDEDLLCEHAQRDRKRSGRWTTTGKISIR